MNKYWEFERLQSVTHSFLHLVFVLKRLSRSHESCEKHNRRKTHLRGEYLEKRNSSWKEEEMAPGKCCMGAQFWGILIETIIPIYLGHFNSSHSLWPVKTSEKDVTGLQHWALNTFKPQCWISITRLKEKSQMIFHTYCFLQGSETLLWMSYLPEGVPQILGSVCLLRFSNVMAQTHANPLLSFCKLETAGWWYVFRTRSCHVFSACLSCPSRLWLRSTQGFAGLHVQKSTSFNPLNPG